VEFITAPKDMMAWSAEARRRARTVGFVPTMGALHTGHLDLVSKARNTCGSVVCSIFVNPLQFNDPKDLDGYPRQLEQDRKLLEQAGCDVLFAPDKAGVFADHSVTEFDLGGLDRHWEGPSRPGHFQGVANVVERLFFHVRPEKAFFGEKDRQQLAIIRHVAKAYLWPEEIVGCPTVRDTHGLALSSRNQRLSDEQQKAATVLIRTLRHVASLAFRTDLKATHQAATAMLASEPSVVLDHFGIAHPDTLEPLQEWGDLDHAIALIAAQVGPVRLIDNITLLR
jgi:pantoate--beta-alanine ligase